MLHVVAGGSRVSADGEDEEKEEDADFMIVEDSSSDSEEDEVCTHNYNYLWKIHSGFILR